MSIGGRARRAAAGSRAGRGVAAVAAVGALLAGCSVSPGTAAVIDGREISQAAVNRASTELTPIVEGATPDFVLSALVLSPAFVEAAADNGVAVSRAEAVAAMDEQVGAVGAEEVEEWSDASIEVVRLFLANEALLSLPDGAEVATQAQEQAYAADVEVNPRYGELDPETGRIARETPPWIVPQEETVEVPEG